MDVFSYIVPPSPTSTVDVDSYYPTSNWQDGQWQYQDLSYMLHNPALGLPMERPRYSDASASRMPSNAGSAQMPAPQPPSSEPLSSNAKEGASGSNVGWYFAGGIALLAIGFAVAGASPKGISLKKSIR
jgi:hypothetical protein